MGNTSQVSSYAKGRFSECHSRIFTGNSSLQGCKRGALVGTIGIAVAPDPSRTMGSQLSQIGE
jgi:hypothetical protein